MKKSTIIGFIICLSVTVGISFVGVKMAEDLPIRPGGASVAEDIPPRIMTQA